MKIRAALRYTFTVLALIPLALTPLAAEAKPKAAKAAAEPAPAKKKSIAFAPLDGKKNAEVRGWLKEAMGSGFELTDAEDFKVKADPAAYAKMGSDLGVDAVAVAKVEKTKLTVTIYASSDGRVIIALQFKAAPGPKLKSIIEKRLVKKLYAAFGIETPEEAARKRAEAKQMAEEEAGDDEGDEGDEEEAPKKKKKAAEAAKAEAEEAPESEEKGDAEEEKSDESSASSGPRGPIDRPFDIRGGLQFSKRSFAFNDTLSQLAPQRNVSRPLRDYNGGLDLAVFAKMELYPGGLLGADGLASNLGLVGGFTYGIPSTTVYRPSDGSAPKNLKSEVHEWYVGAKGRLPLGPKANIGLVIAYAQQRYFLKGDEVGALVPDIQYRYVRIGPDLHLDMGKLSLDAALGARLVLATGELERPELWFKNVGARGLDAALTLGYNVTPSVSVLVGGNFTRYGFNFNPILPSTQGGSGYVAGGATDQYFGGWLGAGFHLPGSKGSE